MSLRTGYEPDSHCKGIGPGLRFCILHNVITLTSPCDGNSSIVKHSQFILHPTVLGTVYSSYLQCACVLLSDSFISLPPLMVTVYVNLQANKVDVGRALTVVKDGQDTRLLIIIIISFIPLFCLPVFVLLESPDISCSFV